MPRHFSEEERRAIEAEIIRVGLELFEIYGVNKTNVSDITTKVGISKGAFYSFFASKGDLFMKIFQMEREKVQSAAEEMFDACEGGIGPTLKAYMCYIRDKLEERPILNLAYDAEAFTAVTDISVRKSLTEYNETINARMSAMLKRWMDKCGNYTADPAAVTGMMRGISLLKYHVHSFSEGTFQNAISAIMDAIVLYVEHSKAPD